MGSALNNALRAVSSGGASTSCGDDPGLRLEFLACDRTGKADLITGTSKCHADRSHCASDARRL